MLQKDSSKVNLSCDSKMGKAKDALQNNIYVYCVMKPLQHNSFQTWVMSMIASSPFRLGDRHDSSICKCPRWSMGMVVGQLEKYQEHPTAPTLEPNTQLDTLESSHDSFLQTIILCPKDICLLCDETAAAQLFSDLGDVDDSFLALPHFSYEGALQNGIKYDPCLIGFIF